VTGVRFSCQFELSNDDIDGVILNGRVEGTSINVWSNQLRVKSFTPAATVT
jgi:hypothetical protein